MSNSSLPYSNASRWTNYSSNFRDNFQYYYIATVTVDTIFTVAGTLINVWFLAAMLLSPEIRARMRNKIICGVLVVNLTESLILCPITAIRAASMLIGVYHKFDCSFQTIHNIIYHIQDFVGNWYILILLCVYMVQIVNFEPRFTPLWKTILTGVILISPLIFALLFVPLTMKSYYLRYSDDRCLITTYQAIKVFKALDTIVPQALASLLLVVTAVFKYRRYPQEHSFDTLRAQLIDDRSQIDPLKPFIALLVTAVVTDLPMVVAFMSPLLFIRLGFHVWVSLYLVFGIVTYLRLIIVPLVMLLFPDIRERIKTWRPCGRSALSADLVVTYEKNTS
ncbi:unnamed protein product [Candidula unifasciata]|uniref:Uncharacterized protein n=1 Tax=Candidula unifasciata TaxID=100452 RepID=A0A8S4A4U9_9EUPU|nr:unnamed protein product [Candidula unifasciata]